METLFWIGAGGLSYTIGVFFYVKSERLFFSCDLACICFGRDSQSLHRRLEYFELKSGCLKRLPSSQSDKDGIAMREHQTF